MSKVIRLTESELVTLINRVIKEQTNDVYTYKGDACLKVRQELSRMGYKQDWDDGPSDGGQHKDFTKFKYKNPYDGDPEDSQISIYIDDKPRIFVYHNNELFKIVEKVAKAKGIRMDYWGGVSLRILFKDCNSLLQFVKELDPKLK